MCYAKGIRRLSENVVKNILKPLNLSKTNQLSIKNDHDQRFGIQKRASKLLYMGRKTVILKKITKRGNFEIKIS
jgi:hypothetical protein